MYFLHMTVEVAPTATNHVGFCSWPYGLIKEGQIFLLYTLLTVKLQGRITTQGYPCSHYRD